MTEEIAPIGYTPFIKTEPAFKNAFKSLIKNYKLRAYGIYVDAYTNEDGKVKKNVSHPAGKTTELKTEGRKKDLIKNDKEDRKYNHFGKLYSKTQGGLVHPNGIAILTPHSNISCLDVDKPNECIILDKLLNDCKLIIKTKNGYHFYFNKEEVLPRNDCRNGIIDINTRILYYCPEYKHIITGEIYKYEIIKMEPLSDMPDYAIDYCKTLISISEINGSSRANKQKDNTNKPKMIIKPDIEIEKFSLETLDSIYDIFYNAKNIKGECMFENVNDWRNIGYMSRHLNNSYEALELFHKYSIQIEKYKNMSIKNSSRGFYGNNEYNLNFDENLILYKCCKLDRYKYAKTLKHLEINKYEDTIIPIYSQYIKPEDGRNDYIFKEWLENYKILCLKSSYGTGKTHTFKKLIEESMYVDGDNGVKSKMPRILFITYRQSLANSLSKDLKENYDFVNYLDINNNSYSSENRLILQLDSIYKLDDTYENGGEFDLLQHEEQVSYLLDEANNVDLNQRQGYDLLVLDEMEGILNHLSFNKINQFQIHNKLCKLIETSKKVLVLDGDLGNRTLDFISDVSSSYKVYENSYKPNKKHFQFTHEKELFDNYIHNDMQNNLKVVIVSMTKTETVKYYTMYSELGKKCIVHNSLTKNKNILEDVNANWKDCDLLTYSPSVESGVDFNVIDHFDKCYAIVENRSTSYRAFCQMLNRVRHYKQDTIMCLMPRTMRYKLDDVLIRFDEIRMQKYRGLEITNLINILIHNDVERYNSKNYFITALCNMLEKKGHTFEELKKEDFYKMSLKETVELLNSSVIQNLYNNGEVNQINAIGAIMESGEFRGEHLRDLRVLYTEATLESIDMINGLRRRVKGKDEIIKAIHNSKTLSDDEFKLLLKKQQSNQQITDDELLSINKMLYMKVFKFIKIDDMTIDNLTKIYNNIDNMKNYNYLLFNSKSSNIIEELVKDDNDVLGKMEMTKLSTLNNLLQNLGYQFKMDKIIYKENITEQIQLNKFDDYKNMIIEFIKTHKTLYNCERTFKTINWLKCLNDILCNYGITCEKIERKITVNGVRVKKYYLDFELTLSNKIYVKNYYKYYANKLNELKEEWCLEKDNITLDSIDIDDLIKTNERVIFKQIYKDWLDVKNNPS